MTNVVHVVGTGTIGEPLLGLFADFRERMGIDEVTRIMRLDNASGARAVLQRARRKLRAALDRRKEAG